jgi:LysR family transcriptional regulator for bpeEF and oprC
MDKLRAMTWFCRAAEAKSFADAAKAIGVVPSALSKTIAALEAEIGVHLVNRSTKRLSLTHEGEVYYEQCRGLLQDFEQAEAIARGGQMNPRGILRVGMHPALRVVLLHTLGSFLDQWPDLNIETVVTNSPTAVVDEGLDLVVRIGRMADSSLVARSLGRVQSIACAAPRYLSSAGDPRHPDDLAKHRAIIYGRRDEASNAEWTFTKGTERITVSVPVRIVVRDGIGITDAVVGGCGVALPLDVSVRHLLKSGALQALLPDWSGERYPVFAVMPPSRGNLPAKVRACVEFVAAMIQQG